MSGQDKIKYHSERAMAELDMALRAGSYDAAQAHFRLSSLHLDTMRHLTVRTQAGPGSTSFK